VKEADENVKMFEEFVFNKSGQLCRHSKRSFIQVVEPHSTIDKNLKASKDGLFIVIPIVKTHLFGNAEFDTVDFCHLNAQTLQLHEYKYRTNIH